MAHSLPKTTLNEHRNFLFLRDFKTQWVNMAAVPDLPIGLSLGPQDPRGHPTNCGTHRVNGRYMII